MTPYSKDYIVTGEVFVDESVLCIRCGTPIMGLSYKEMPSAGDPKKMVNVAFKKVFNNHKELPVVMIRHGRETIVSLPICSDCIKTIVPERDTDQIVQQIKRAMQVEARYIGMSPEAISEIARGWADARVIRKLTSQEVAEGKILQEA